MGKFFNNWRYYSFGRELYVDCMKKLFINNLNSLRQANKLAAIIIFCFSLFPLFYNRDFVVMGICILAGIIAAVFSSYLNYKMQVTIVNNTFIYLFTSLFYLNIMAFSIYLGIWIYPGKVSVFFISFLICAPLVLINPPVFNFCLTAGAMVIFFICTLFFKTYENFIFDIINTLIAGVISLYFCWNITKLRLEFELSANMLEEERNKYLNQSTTDELTQLNNRRDFFKTFKRYLSSYRTNDEWLCVAIGDIDFFKNYNDHYGHPKGDECLRSIGLVFNELKDTMGVYAARVGGEEFAMLWFEKEASHVNEVVTYVADILRELKIPHEKSKVSEIVTMSIGVYVERSGSRNDEQTLYDFADKSLYVAKGSGRNCAIISGREIDMYKVSPRS
jgi:diguanylate cyclase (GGDEF)-like protein